MAQKNYDKLEENIIKAFTPEEDGKFKQFRYNGKLVEAYFGGKPKQHSTPNDPRPGNPKTDVYIGVREINNTNNTDSIKISVKQDNATFVENWVKANRAQELFPGDNDRWKDVILQCFHSLHKELTLDELMHTDSNHGTGLKLGWCFFVTMKLTGKDCGSFSEIITNPDEQAYLLNEVYAGTNMSEGKRNCTVGLDNKGIGFGDSSLIENSGVANCMLHTDLSSVNSPQQIVDQLTPMPTKLDTNNDLYFMFKAVNGYDDGVTNASTPLAIPIKWNVTDKYIYPEIMDTKEATFALTNADALYELKKIIEKETFEQANTINEAAENNLIQL